MSEHDERDLRERLQQLELLVRQMEESADSPALARARQLVRAVLDLHASGLRRMLEIVAARDIAAPPLIGVLAEDAVVAAVLLLHGLHPLDVETRVRRAVDALGAALAADGVGVALLAVTDAAVRVSLVRDARRGGLPAVALRTLVENAILAAAPDAVSLEIDVPDDPMRGDFVPLEQVRLRERSPATGARPA